MGVGDHALVWASFLRLATNRRIFDVPTPRPEVFAFVEATRAQPFDLPVGSDRATDWQLVVTTSR